MPVFFASLVIFHFATHITRYEYSFSLLFILPLAASASYELIIGWYPNSVVVVTTGLGAGGDTVRAPWPLLGCACSLGGGREERSKQSGSVEWPAWLALAEAPVEEDWDCKATLLRCCCC